MPKGNNGDYSVVERKDAQALGSGNSKLMRSILPIDGVNSYAAKGSQRRLSPLPRHEIVTACRQRNGPVFAEEKSA